MTFQLLQEWENEDEAIGGEELEFLLRASL